MRRPHLDEQRTQGEAIVIAERKRLIKVQLLNAAPFVLAAIAVTIPFVAAPLANAYTSFVVPTVDRILVAAAVLVVQGFSCLMSRWVGRSRVPSSRWQRLGTCFWSCL